MSPETANYDNPWKATLELYFEAFLTFAFPAVHTLIDWSQGYQSLEQEFHPFQGDNELGNRYTDKLFQVWQRNGTETWILVHVEVQAEPESDFAERMFVYNYRCFDRYRKSIISLAILGDDRPNWRPCTYSYNLGGCQMGITFPILKLLDYEPQWQVLQASRNPFGLMVMAHLKTKATTGKPEQRKQWKWTLIRDLFEQGYSRENIVDLFHLVDWMMTLPPELDQELRRELKQYQADRRVPYLSSFERLAKEEGREEGAKQALQETIATLLQARFGAVPPSLIETLSQIEDMTRLKQSVLQVMTVGSVEEFQQQLHPPD